eukprot:4940660-Pyramimonas_sp.AAC.1
MARQVATALAPLGRMTGGGPRLVAAALASAKEAAAALRPFEGALVVTAGTRRACEEVCAPPNDPQEFDTDTVELTVNNKTIKNLLATGRGTPRELSPPDDYYY